MRLTDTIHSERDLKEQYKNSQNLGARAAIYRFSVRPERWPAWLMDRWISEVGDAANILELGAGPGGIWKGQLDRVPAGWRVLLTDLMEGMVAEAKASLGHDARFSFRQMHAEQIDLPDASLDAVFANHMLYHVEDRPRAFREIHRVLKPGGKLIAGTNSERHLAHMQKLIGGFVSGHSNSGMPFSLENGAEQIAPFFASIARENLINTLRITEADAVVQYVLSVQAAKEIVVWKKLQELRERVQREINEAGAFVDQTHVGVFIGRKI